MTLKILSTTTGWSGACCSLATALLSALVSRSGPTNSGSSFLAQFRSTIPKQKCHLAWDKSVETKPTSTPSGKAKSIRPNPSEDSSRTPRGGKTWAFERLESNIRRKPPVDLCTKKHTNVFHRSKVADNIPRDFTPRTVEWYNCWFLLSTESL